MTDSSWTCPLVLLDSCLPGLTLPPSLLHLMGPGSFLSVEKKAPSWGRGPPGHQCPCIGRALALCSFLRLFLYVALRGFSHLVSLSQVKLFANGFHICLCPPLPKHLFLTSLRFKSRFCWLCAKERQIRKVF